LKKERVQIRAVIFEKHVTTAYSAFCKVVHLFTCAIEIKIENVSLKIIA